MTRLLFKTWVAEFYRTYAGFLFVIYLFLFGFLSGREHLAIAQFLISDVKNLLLPAMGVILYGFLVVLYSNNFIRKPENRMLSNLIFLPFSRRTASILAGLNWLFLPVTLYGTFLMAVAIMSGNPVISLVILIFFAVVALAAGGFIHREVIRPGEKIFGYSWNFSSGGKNRLSFLIFLMKHLFLFRGFSLFISKLLSFSVLFVFTLLIPTVDIYSRFLGIGIFAGVLSNSLLPFEMFRFTMIRVNFIKNLPLRRSCIYLQSSLGLFLLMLPEIFFIYRNFSGFMGPLSITVHLLSGLSVLALLSSGLLITDLDQKKFINHVFWIFLMLVFYRLYDLPVILILVFSQSAAYFIFHRYYYLYEPRFDISE